MRKTIKLTLPIRAIPCPRPRRSQNGGVYMLPKYMQYKRVLKEMANFALELDYQITVDKMNQIIDIDEVITEFYFKIPKSRLKNTKIGDKYRQTPDEDNARKTVLDALILKDARISDGGQKKRWADSDYIIVIISGEATK